MHTCSNGSRDKAASLDGRCYLAKPNGKRIEEDGDKVEVVRKRNDRVISLDPLPHQFASILHCVQKNGEGGVRENKVHATTMTKMKG